MQAARTFLRPSLRSTLVRTIQPHTRNMHVTSLPMWVGSGNNYAYLVVDDKTKDAVIIDPANPPEVLPHLKEQTQADKIKLTAILNTHHHGDHAGGNRKILAAYAGIPVIGGKDCDAVTRTPAHNSTFKIGDAITVTAIYTPCHTQDSICYFMEDGNQRVVFTGDTLFIGGCGKFFEGTGAQMHEALVKRLGALPDDTKVYPGHEYTKNNCKFLESVDPNDAVKKLKAFAEANRETQGQFTIGDEKKHNIFMRADDPAVQKMVGESDGASTMQKLRSMKDNL